MKTIYTLLLGAIMTVVGLNIGLHYGLTAKPVLDIDKCHSITRYEDGSLVCDPDGRKLQAEDDGATDQLIIRGDEYRPVPAMSGAELQPAATIEHYQPVKEYR